MARFAWAASSAPVFEFLRAPKAHLLEILRLAESLVAG
jgi:hypothetical protein